MQLKVGVLFLDVSGDLLTLVWSATAISIVTGDDAAWKIGRCGLEAIAMACCIINSIAFEDKGPICCSCALVAS